MGSTSRTKTEEDYIYLLPDGRYQVEAWAVNHKTGKRTKRLMTNPPIHTMEQAIKRRDQIILELEGAPVEQPPRPTLGVYAKQWWALIEGDLRPSTRATYLVALKQKIVPVIGDIYIDSFTRQDAIAWVQWAESQTQPDGKPYAQSTLRGWKRVLWTMLKDMAADFDLPDPTRRVKAPKSDRKKVRARETLTLEELRAFVEAMQAVVPDRYAETCTLAYTGMRSGEMWALHVDQIEGGAVHICRAVSRGIIQDVTKTGWERHAYLPEFVQEAHAEHRQEMIRSRHRGLKTGLIFPSNAATPRTSGSLDKPFKKARKHAGLEKHVSPRVLRRTYNTLLLEGEIPEAVVQSQLGHADRDMSLYYFDGHLEAKQKAFEKVFGAG